MRYDLYVAWRNLRNRPIETFVPIIVVALAIALSVSVFALSDGAEEGIVQASDPFGVMVIGSAGSGQELVLSSILLQGNPIGNIPYDVYKSLEADDARVQLAVPLAFGDNYEGFRIIGTDENFFELRRDQASPPAFQLAQGRLFAEFEGHDDHDHDEDGEHEDEHEAETHDEDSDHEGEHEAETHDEDSDHDDATAEVVIGAKVASGTGLSIGDTFFGTHGVSGGIAENLHEDLEFQVVGILQTSHTAYDTAIYTSIEAVWDVHDHDDEEAFAGAPTIENLGLAPEVAAAPEADQVTTVLVLPTGFIEQNQLAQQFYLEPTLQAAFPGQELGNLINLLNQGQQVLEIVGYMVLAIAGLTLFLSMYSAVLARQQSIAIMRGLGNNRLSIARIIIFETLIVSIAGALLGRALGYLLAFVIAQVYSAQAAIPIPIRYLVELEGVLWGLSLIVGVLAGLIPALMAYRVNVVERLFPS